MTDRLTGVEVLESLGQAADPPVSNAGESRTYFNTTTNRMLISENGGPYRDVNPVEEVEYIPRPEGGFWTATAPLATATLQAASFVLPRRVRFNRLVFRVGAFTPPATGGIFLYQDPQGRVVASCPLVASITFTPAAGTVFQVAPAEGEVVLSDGIYFALWGQASGAGSFNLPTYDFGGINTINDVTTPAGVHPVGATSILDPATPPASIDPMVGGDLVADTGDHALVHRLRKV